MAINFDEAAEWLAANLDLVNSRRHKFVNDMAASHWSPSDKQVDFLLDLYDQAKAREARGAPV